MSRDVRETEAFVMRMMWIAIGIALFLVFA